MKGQKTGTLTGERIVSAFQEWCRERFLSQSPTLGLGFMVWARMDEESRIEAMKAFRGVWERADFTIDMLDPEDDSLPRFAIVPSSTGEAGGSAPKPPQAAGGALRRAADSATRRKGTRSSRGRKSG